MANPIGARKNACFKAVSTAPSINKTPVGAATPPLPYPVFQDLSNSTGIVPSVRFNGDPAYVLDQTTQPSCKGDDPGSVGGVKSGTVNGEVKPIQGSCSVRAGGHWVIRQGDPCTMNSGNCPGIYTTTQTPSLTGAGTTDNNPRVMAETPEEEGWLQQFLAESKEEINQAWDHPVDGVIGAGKGLVNMVPDLLELAVNKTAEGESHLFAWGADKLGYADTAQQFREVAGDLNQGVGTLKLPKFEMNAAERGGDKILTLASLATGLGGLLKGGGKMLTKGGLKALSNEVKLVESAALPTVKGLDDAKTLDNAIKSTEVVVEPAKGGVKIIERIKSLREQYLGRTPGKNSRTGREVQERMRAEGKLRDNIDTGRQEFQASDGKWYDLKYADMAHNPVDAVTWWNEIGRQYGAKSPEVREWMLKSKNYTLEHYSINRAAGPKIGETYLPSLK